MKVFIKQKLAMINAVMLLLPFLLFAQVPQSPLELCSYKKSTSHEALLSYINQLGQYNSQFIIESIGTTVQNRTIPMVHFLRKDAGLKLKVLLFCQQHGNEPSGKEAALLLLKKLAAENGHKLFPNLDLYIVPSVNPDGNEAGKRANANGADLNRNHLILSQPEVQAVHNVFARINPEVTLDVHEYSAFRKEFREVGYFRTADEQFGAPTNLNVSDKIIGYALNNLFPFLESELKSKGVIFSNYYKMNGPDDTVRTSTTSIDDGRQSFAILNNFSFILEGKNGKSMNDELKRRSSGQLAAIESFLMFVNNNCETIKKLVDSEKIKMTESAEPVAVKMDYIYDGSMINLEMKTVSDKDTIVSMHYSPQVKLIESVERPEAYVIPASQKEVIEVLDRHGIVYKRLDQPEELELEIYKVNSVIGKWMENKPTDYVLTSKRREKVILNPGDVFLPLNNVYASMLVSALEPSSMWGLVQYDEFPNLREVGKDFPIFRIPVHKRK